MRLIDVQKRIVPDILEVLHKRYRILQFIRSSQPIGRRSLAQAIDLTERVLRKETDFLKNQGLLHFSSVGMRLSSEGEQVLGKMDEFMRHWLGLTELEQRLQQRFAVREVIIVPGDSTQSPWIKHDLGRAAALKLQQTARENWIVSVAGGTTMAAIAEALTPHPVLKTLHYVPARGGLGEDVENQASTICSLMAARTGGHYRLLHVPDQLSKEAYDSLLEDEQIREIVELIRSSSIVLHGIGEATTMAKRRKADEAFLQKLKDEEAVAEAFGYYFNSEGKIIHKIQTIGLKLQDLKQAAHVIAVAGGRAKAQAILAFLKQGMHDVLITDEGAAREMLAV